jgi:hypothetical protein
MTMRLPLSYWTPEKSYMTSGRTATSIDIAARFRVKQRKLGSGLAKRTKTSLVWTVWSWEFWICKKNSASLWMKHWCKCLGTSWKVYVMNSHTMLFCKKIKAPGRWIMMVWRCCYITVDSVTPASQNSASFNSVFLNRSCGWTLLLLNDWYY